VVQLYGREGGETIVNTQTGGSQVAPYVAQLSSGGFVVIWTDSGSYTSAKGQIYDSAGAKVGGEFTVSTAGTQPTGANGVAALPDGGFVATFGNYGEVYAQRFDANGAQLGWPIEVTPYDRYFPQDFGSAVAVLADGGFVVAWTKEIPSFFPGAPGDFEIYARRFDAGGTPIGEPFLVNSTTQGFQLNPTVTALESGGFVVSWDDQDLVFASSAQIYDAQGDRVGEEFRIQATGGRGDYSGGAVIAALPGGGFVASWTEEILADDGSSEASVKARLFDESGVAIGPEILVNNVTGGYRRASDIEILPWGGFLVTWSDSSEQNGDGDSYGVLAQVFDAAGGKIGPAFLVNASTLGDQGAAAFAVLASGNLAFAWTDNDLGQQDNHDSDIKGQIFRPLPDNGDDVITGDDGPNILDGGDGNDTINALGGNDTLDGEGGNDLVRAGPGDDRVLVSGTGADVAEGGTGFDTLVVDYRDATLRISMTPPTANPNGGFNGTIGGGGRRIDYNGIEALIVTTGSGDDLLIGLGRDDVLDGGIGNDIVRGGAGNDRLLVSGGGGADAIEGGAGFDTLVVDYRDSAIRISMTAPTFNPLGGYNGTIGGGGRRIDYNGVEAVVVATGSGDDSLNGLAGNDVLDGGAGNDAVSGGAGDDRLIVSGRGVDSAAGGSGFDTLVVDYGDSAIRISMTAPTANPAGGSNGTIGGGGRRTDYNGIEAFVITTGSGSDGIVTGGGNDRIRPGSGADAVSAGGGDDTLLFLASLNAADAVDGGAGVDTLILQGNYATGLPLANVRNLEVLVLLSGKNKEYGEPGTNRFDYAFTTADSTFAAGVQALINGIDLAAGEDLTFNGAAESDASFLIQGGRGVDTLTGGLGDDIFFFAHERFAQGDKVNGGGGDDILILRGNYSISFTSPDNAGRLAGIETILLVSASDPAYAPGGGRQFNYQFDLADADVAPGATLTVDGSSLGSGESLYIDGSRETDGFLQLLGGAMWDTLTGGAGADVIQGGFLGDDLRGGGGADVFRYASAEDAPSYSLERILDFTPGTDRIDLTAIDADSLAAGDQAFHWIGTAAFSGTGAASAGELRLVETQYGGYIEGDVNGNGSADFVIEVWLQGPTPLGAGDFIL
jgi:serralysin